MQRVLAAAGGIILALLALGTVLLSVRSNHRQEQLVRCGGIVVQQTINALQTERDTRVQLNARTQIIVRARQEAYHVMADVITGRSSGGYATLDNAMANYDKAVDAYSAAITNDDNAMRNAPLPNVNCLTGGLRNSAQSTVCPGCS